MTKVNCFVLLNILQNSSIDSDVVTNFMGNLEIEEVGFLELVVSFAKAFYQASAVSKKPHPVSEPVCEPVRELVRELICVLVRVLVQQSPNQYLKFAKPKYNKVGMWVG